MVIRYNESYELEWDNFVLEKSINGCFLQTRNFLNYHKNGKFIDHSLIFFKGEMIVAVMPANEIGDELFSHQGSTFGGIVIGEQFASLAVYECIFEELLDYLSEKGFRRIVIKTPNWLYCRKDIHIELLDYLYGLNGFEMQGEVGFFIDLEKIADGFENKFATLKRRKLKKAQKNSLIFKELYLEHEIAEFYNVLEDNMEKFGTIPLHSLEELLEFKNNRLTDIISFYGVYNHEEMIAGCMVFNFNNKKVFHTQYLASRHDKLELCPNEFLYANLIMEARRQEYRFLSYGTSTLEHGTILNRSLALFKEGFNTESYINRTYSLENIERIKKERE